MDAAPKKPAPPLLGRRFYYGWVIVATMFIVSVAQTAQYNPAISIFVKPITEDFGWSRTTFSTAIGIGGIVGAGLAVVIGPILDRRGPRIPTLIAFMLLGGVVMSLSQISEIWQFYAIIVTNRALNTGFLSIVAGVVVAKWFIRRRGRAMSSSNPLSLAVGALARRSSRPMRPFSYCVRAGRVPPSRLEDSFGR